MVCLSSRGPNSAKLLRPGLTATANILVSETKDAILVPNGALRFKPDIPDSERETPYARPLGRNEFGRRFGCRPGRKCCHGARWKRVGQ